MDPITALEQFGGVARWSRLSGDISRRALDAAVRRGLVRRVGRGTYALPGTHEAFITAVRSSAFLSHTTAAAYWGLDHLEAAGVHLAIPTNSTRRITDAVVHRVDLPAKDVDITRIPVTAVLRTLIDCARSLPLREALVIADSALRKGYIDERSLRAAAATIRGIHAKRARRILTLATGSAESVAESVLRSIFYLSRRLPDPLVQHQVRSDDKLIAQVDLALLLYRGRIVNLAVELDGYDYHSSRADYRRDRYRRNELARRGWGHLAVTYEDAVHNQAYVSGLIYDTLEVRWRYAPPAD